MSEYEVLFRNTDDGSWMSKGNFYGIRNARKEAYKTYKEESQWSDIEVKIVYFGSQYPIETINNNTVYGA